MQAKVTQKITKFNAWLGRTVSWLTLLMVILTFVIVILRKFFDTGWIWMQESVTWMHACVFMLAAAYTLQNEEHVRVDIFYTNFSPKKKALVNLLGAILLLLPLCTFIIWSSFDYVIGSWRIRESSWQSGGLPILFILKTIIPITALLLLVQGVLSSINAYFLSLK